MAETKANPNPNGCFARALPHEPMFILLARDQAAPEVIRHWAAQRQLMVLDGDLASHSEQIVDAMDSADTFERWRAEHDGEWRGAEAKRAARIERYARRIAAACSPEESVDAIWMAHTDEAAAVLAEIEREEAENA